MKDKIIEKVISDYLSARKTFLEVANKYPEELKGNDNIIGRIGEYRAIEYLRDSNMAPRKVVSKSQQGYDIICNTNTRVSVKVITCENTRGRTVRLTDPWDHFVLIEFNENYAVYRVGHLTRDGFNKALNDNPKFSKKPYVKITMLGPKGLIGRYGTVEKRKFC